MEIHFNGPVQNVYTGNTEVYNDNAKKVVINSSTSSPNPATQHAQQAQVVEDVVPVTTPKQPETPTTEQQPTVKYSSYLKRGANPLKSDDEVQQNFVNAAKSGPSALVDYLLSQEGRLYFDVFNIKPSVFVNTVNKECGTDIAVKSYETAKYRKM